VASWDGSSVDVWLSMSLSEGCDRVCIGIWERCAGIGVGNFEWNNEFRQIIWVTLLLVHQWLFPCFVPSPNRVVYRYLACWLK